MWAAKCKIDANKQNKNTNLLLQVSGYFLCIFKQFEFIFHTALGEPVPRPSYCGTETVLAPIFVQPQSRNLRNRNGTLTTKASFAVPILVLCGMGCGKDLQSDVWTGLLNVLTTEEQVPLWAKPLAQYCLPICHMDTKIALISNFKFSLHVSTHSYSTTTRRAQ